MKAEQERDIENLVQVRKTANWARYTTAAITTLLGGIFTVKKFQGVPVLAIASDDWAHLFIQLALIIYFWSWIFGSRADLNAQESVVREIVVGKKKLISLFLWCGLLVLTFVILWKTETFLHFSIVLALFLILDLIAGHYYYKIALRPQFDKSRKLAASRGNVLFQIDIDIVDKYMKGKWWKWRFIAGFSWIIAFALLNLTGQTHRIVRVVSAFSVDSFLSFSTLVYVMFMEITIWAFRVKREAERFIIRNLPAGYHITRANE
jgi:hypothetical protein